MRNLDWFFVLAISALLLGLVGMWAPVSRRGVIGKVISLAMVAVVLVTVAVQFGKAL